jgi:hypothetical protein
VHEPAQEIFSEKPYLENNVDQQHFQDHEEPAAEQGSDYSLE